MSAKEYRARGLYFEDLNVGDSMVSPGRTVTESDIVAFCGLSGDYNELHSNAEYAGQTLFGKRIAHGLLGLALASGLAGRLGFLEGTAQAFMGLQWRFRAPVFIGDTVHMRARVKQKREVKRLQGGIIIFEAQLWNQSGSVVQEGEWTLLLRSRPVETQAAG